MDSQKNGKTVDVYFLPTKSSEQDEEKLSSTKSFWHVDKEMLRFKIHYFLYVGGIAAGIPYVIVLAKDRLGVSASSLGVALNAIFTLSDTACNESIQKYGGSFGQQRLWGGIGWGTVAPLAGFINDYTDGYLASYILMGVMMVLFLINMSTMDLVKPHFSKNILKDVGTVLKSKDFLIFEAMVFINGLGTVMIWFYLIWFLNSIGGSELLCGLSMTVQSFVGVIPFMFFSDYIIKKLGHFNILIVGLAGYTTRFLWYSYLQNPWMVLPVEFLHGITYGLYYPTLASYAKLTAKPGTEATTQAIIFSTHEGLGSGIGCVISGIAFDYFGGHQTYFYSSMICLSGAFMALIYSLHLQRRKGTIQLATE
ncbi:hypothetical protein JTE90_015330 [Oedothorax gibbosus]|uniref:Major facilitator superfamily associated domain-containing protein n=1 Tax=Oedothorax gibbosus TaxID=931172 RepID=A0AAV6U5B4_9ARAC|nr:hypothetical protein JTE90_015330 [Oedothorax gibbosus]